MQFVRRSFVSLIIVPGLLLVTALPAQTTSPAKKTVPVHRKVAPAGPTLPKNIPPVKGPLKTEFALRYQDITIGTGDLAKPGMMYSVNYTGWLASDGTKFDSSYDRGRPIEFPVGMHRVIPGWDLGFDGMHIGGKRRLFIPYQLAYGEAGKGPIPPKSDLIFDIELMGMSELPQMQPRMMIPPPQQNPSTAPQTAPAQPQQPSAVPQSTTPPAPPKPQ